MVKFIEKNTAGVAIGTGGNEFIDPYTGKCSRCLISDNSELASKVRPDTGHQRIIQQFARRKKLWTRTPVCGAFDILRTCADSDTPRCLKIPSPTSTSSSNVLCGRRSVDRCFSILRLDIGRPSRCTCACRICRVRWATCCTCALPSNGDSHSQSL